MLSTLCDVESLLETWVRNTLERPEARGVKEAERVEDRLGVKELSAVTWPTQGHRAGRSKPTRFPGNLSVAEESHNSFSYKKIPDNHSVSYRELERHRFHFLQRNKKNYKELGNVFVSYSSIFLALACSDPCWRYTWERRHTESKDTLISEWIAKTCIPCTTKVILIYQHKCAHTRKSESSFLPKPHFTLC